MAAYPALLSAPANIIVIIMNKPKGKGGERTISTHEMRFEFDRVLRAVKAGRTLTLTYRSKPLARIVPLPVEPECPKDDPIFRLDELSEPIGPLTNREIDSAIYGH